MDEKTQAFVAAADALINLLNGPEPTTSALRTKRLNEIEKAYTAYEEARYHLTGEAPGEDEDDDQAS